MLTLHQTVTHSFFCTQLEGNLIGLEIKRKLIGRYLPDIALCDQVSQTLHFQEYFLLVHVHIFYSLYGGR